MYFAKSVYTYIHTYVMARKCLILKRRKLFFLSFWALPSPNWPLLALREGKNPQRGKRG
jgi:hypothetical protein